MRPGGGGGGDGGGVVAFVAKDAPDCAVDDDDEAQTPTSGGAAANLADGAIDAGASIPVPVPIPSPPPPAPAPFQCMSATIGRFGRIDGKRISGVAPGVGLYPNPSALTLRYALPSSTLLGASARVASRAYAPVCSGCRGCRLSGVRSSSDASSPTARTSRFEKRAYGFVAELNRSRLDTDASPGGTAPRPSSGANEVFSAPTRPFVSFSTFRATVSRRGAARGRMRRRTGRRRGGARGPEGVLASLGEGGEASEELDGVAVAARAELVFGGIVFGLRATRDDAKAVVRGSGREGPRVVMQRAKIAPSLGGGVPGQGKDGDGAAGAGQGGDLGVHRGDARVNARERRALGLDARGDAAQHALARRLERLERREHLLVRLALREVRSDRRHGEPVLHVERKTRERRGTPAPPPPRARHSAGAGGCCAGGMHATGGVTFLGIPII